MCLQVFLSLSSIIPMQAGFVVYKFQWAPIPRGFNPAFRMLFKSLFEILSESDIVIAVFGAMQYVGVIHFAPNNFTG